MNTPQERVIKKMIDNIVESNKPVFERPTANASLPTSGIQSAAPSTTASASTPAPSSSAPMASSEETSMITRKLDYGFNSLRTENAELRKQIDELSGAIKMLRNDMDTIRQSVTRGANPHMTPAREAPTQPMTSSAGGNLGSAGAPQYKQTEADSAWESQNTAPSGDEKQQPSTQARGFQKKEDQGAQIDISKVFYYGKK